VEGPKEITDFIKWRYSPSRYKWATFSDQSLVIYRVEKRRFFNLVIIVDAFFTKHSLKKNVKSICYKESALAYIFLYSKKTAVLKSFLSVKRQSPVIVSKDANGVLDKYDFALGDVEGIL
jgi:hypothetical protein